MSDLQEIANAARGRRAVLATVVQVAGSAYRRPGARMLFPDASEPVGLVSGGCLEADLAERAHAVAASGEARTVVYDMRSPDDIVWGLGLGCNGEVRVLLERLDPDSRPGYLGFLERCLDTRRPGIVMLPFSGARVGRHLLLDASGNVEGDLDDSFLRQALLDRGREALAARRSAVHALEGPAGRTDALVEYVAPPIALVVFGAGSDALPLVSFAKRLGWQVAVVDDRPAHVRPERFAEADRVELVRFESLELEALGIDSSTAVVVMTHHFLHDMDLLRVLLDSEAPYVGLLGPRQRSENLLAELAKQGLEPTSRQRERLFGPVGLDIGSETPEEIALSALAEIRAVLSGREGGFLRRRSGPLHEWPR